MNFLQEVHIKAHYEARYQKSRDENGKIIYGYCYGQTYEEAKEKRDFQLQKNAKPKMLNLLILGAGMHGTDVYEIAKSLRIFSKIDFLDDDIDKERTIGAWDEVEKYVNEYPVAIVAVGNEDTEIGLGTVIYLRATIASGVHIGMGGIVSTGSIVPRKIYIPDWGYFEYDKIIRYTNI